MYLTSIYTRFSEYTYSKAPIAPWLLSVLSQCFYCCYFLNKPGCNNNSIFYICGFGTKYIHKLIVFWHEQTKIVDIIQLLTIEALDMM